MSDIDHTFSGDLSPSAAGDLLASDGLLMANQRILRRLLTNPGDYVWNPEYGAGLPARIGSTLDTGELTGLIRTQMELEAAVSHDPEPEITLTPIANGAKVQIRYTLKATGQPAALGFTVSP